VNRIILDPKPRRPQLPVHTEIDHPAIREAAAAWDGAKATLEGARKDLVELEQTRDAAEWRDAEAAQEARAAGKPEPKRSHVAVHDKKLDEARHRLKVETLSETQAFNSLQDALDEHQADWGESVERAVQAVNDEWTSALEQLVEIHARRSALLAIKAMVVGGDQPSVAAMGFRSGQIRGLDFAQGAGRQTGYVPTGDVFAGLEALGMPAPPTPEPVQHAVPRGSNPLRGQAGVEHEIAERRRFAELT
jgi:hypothetical protein